MRFSWLMWTQVIKNRNRELCTGMEGRDSAGNPGCLSGRGTRQISAIMEESYTPALLRSDTGLNPDDYVSVGSFTHHPFYENFILEIPDNWLWSSI